MPLISEAKLNKIRATVNRTLPDPCQIKRKSKMPDGRGGFVEGPEVTVATVNSRMIAMSYDQERVYGDRLQNRLGFKVLLPYGTDIKDSDKLVISGRTLDVVDVITGQTWELFVQVICSEKR
jgi:hypothetical protein